MTNQTQQHIQTGFISIKGQEKKVHEQNLTA